MSDRLYLSCWVRDFDASNMLDHYAKLLEVFPTSKLTQRNPVLRIHVLEYSEPAAVERPFLPEADVDEIMQTAVEFTKEDCSVELETAWDLWQYSEVVEVQDGVDASDEPSDETGSAVAGDEEAIDNVIEMKVKDSTVSPIKPIRLTSGATEEPVKMDWQVGPSTVRIFCMGPEFANDEGDHLRIEFGLDSQFLPSPGIEGSLDMQQSNLRSLITLVGEITEALDLESRQLWSENGLNFADVLAGAVSEFGPN